VTAGEIIFTDRHGKVWNATEWKYYKRFLDPKTKNENPEYTKAIHGVNTWIGGEKKNAKGVVLLSIVDSNNSTLILGRYTVGDEPSKIGNEELSLAGYERRTKMGGQLSRLNSSDLVMGHRSEILRVGENDLPHYIFKTAAELRATIIRNMKASKFNVLREPAVIQATEEFIDSGATHFDWSKVGGLMNNQDKIKFGIYLVSELSYAFIVMSGKSIGAFPGMSQIKFFAVPTDNTNSSYDSYLRGVVKGGSGIANLMVSSKASIGPTKGGARSTILPALNGMAKSIQNYNTLNNKFLAALLPYFKTSTRGSNTIYPFMIQKVLGLSSSIPDPVLFWNRICKLHGKRKEKLTDAEMIELERQVVAVQKKVAGGIPLVGLGVVAPLNRNAAHYPSPVQWKEFSRYISDMFCDAIAFGLNYDGASDMRPTISWQILLDVATFARSGNANFTMKEVTKETKGMIIDNGKQSAGDPTRNITWLGMRPL
jgi:hypothetical protein